MLSEIYIQNLAVIEKAEIHFDMGLNIFTGETGAGKSIVVDSINAVLGQRISRDIVRTGCEKAVILGVFRDLPEEVVKKAASSGYELEDGQLIVQREIQVDGKNAARLCGRPVNLSVLKEICNDLVNIHGQHDSQTLLAPEHHLDILDSFGGYQSARDEYQCIFAELKSVVMEMKRLASDGAENERRRDLLSYQINEIESAALQPGEDEAVEAELKALQNYSGIAEGLSQAVQYLNGGEEVDGAVGLLSNASSALVGSAALSEELEPVSSSLQEIYYEAEEIAGKIETFLDHFDFDPSRLSYLEDRQDEIRKLKRKYGGTIDEILAFQATAKSEFDAIDNADALLEELAEKRRALMETAREKATGLSEKRGKAAERFAKSVERELKFLDMPNVKLQAALNPCKMNRFGQETVEFMISTNLGEPPKPMSKIASGGELSRIMLAIKNVLADKDRIPTLIFDEVDTGVSGRAAQKIGLKLKEVSHNKQVICVTHLAQIAALADTHLLIEKKSENGRTFTEVSPLDFEGRKREVARIMGTGQMTELLLQNAEDLILGGRELTKQK